MKVKVKKVREGAIIPKYQTEGAAGFDFHAVGNHIIKPGQTMLIPIGLSFEVPIGYEMQVIPRSGMSLKTPLRIANSPGCVDSKK